MTHLSSKQPTLYFEPALQIYALLVHTYPILVWQLPPQVTVPCRYMPGPQHLEAYMPSIFKACILHTCHDALYGSSSRSLLPMHR